MSETNSENNEKVTERPTVVRNASDLQRLKLEKLMRNPDKPILFPEKPKERGMPAVPEFVRNVMGSSAGAGSGEFHVYRHLRRKEYARQKFMKERGERDRLEDEYHYKLEENKRKADEKTAKKRAKRLRQKEKMKKRRKMPKQDEKSSQSEEDSSSESEQEDDETKKEEGCGDNQIKEENEVTLEAVKADNLDERNKSDDVTIKSETTNESEIMNETNQKDKANTLKTEENAIATDTLELVKEEQHEVND